MSSFDISFNPYINILPYFTIIPLAKGIRIIIKKAWNDQDPLISPDANKIKRKSNVKKLIAIFVTTLLLVFLNFIIMLILVKLSSGMRNQWILNAMIFYIQDFCFVPFVGIFITRLKILVLKTKVMMKLPRIKKFVYSTLNKEVAIVMFDYMQSRKFKRFNMPRKIEKSVVKRKMKFS